MNRDRSPNAVPQDGATAPELPSFTQAQVETLTLGYHLHRDTEDNRNLVDRGYLSGPFPPITYEPTFVVTYDGRQMGIRLLKTFVEGAV